MINNITNYKKVVFDVEAFNISGDNKKRKVNEDFMYVDKERNIYIVADGLGGHGGGREASRLTVQSVAERLIKLYDTLQKRDYDPDMIEERITSLIEETNSKIIYPISHFSEGLQNMGTTLLTFFYHKGWAYMHNVGDSHGFLLDKDKNKHLDQLTIDDRIKGEYENCKDKDELKIRLLDAPLKQYVGEEKIEVHAGGSYVKPGDMFLLATDGILTPVHDSEIEYLFYHENFKDIADKLREKANNPKKMVEIFQKITGKDRLKAFDELAGRDDMTGIILMAKEAVQNT